MAISQDLLLAILAMDSYNRGYDAGLRLDPAATAIGNATLGQTSAVLGTAVDVNASFFAQAYTLANDQKVISYRGTDDFALDPLHGWPTGIGVYINAQAKLAAQFFQQVVGWV